MKLLIESTPVSTPTNYKGYRSRFESTISCMFLTVRYSLEQNSLTTNESLPIQFNNNRFKPCCQHIFIMKRWYKSSKYIEAGFYFSGNPRPHMNPSSGRKATEVRALVRPTVSANIPTRETPNPAMPQAKPIMRPEMVLVRFGVNS